MLPRTWASMSVVTRVIVLSVLVALAATPLSASGWAQGFFQNLFGIGNSSPAPSHRSPSPPAGYGYRAPIIPPIRNRDPEDDDQSGNPSFSGNYKTVCVRMCDGYYFPISASVSRRAFYRDANICRSSCGNEARLFVQSASSTDATTPSRNTITFIAQRHRTERDELVREGVAAAPQVAVQRVVDEGPAYVVPQEVSEGRAVTPPIRLTNYLMHHGEYASGLSRTTVHSNVVSATDMPAETDSAEGTR